MPPGEKRGRCSRDSAWSECFALVGFFCFRAAKYAEEITEATTRTRGYIFFRRGRFGNSESKGDFA